jgi:hypothetical protein
VTKTFADFGTMTATAPCELCGAVEPPKFRTFFELTPFHGNSKTIVVKVSGQVLYFCFEWLHDRPTYVKMYTSDNTTPRYVGTYDYSKNRVFTAPTGLSADSQYFVITNMMLEKFAAEKLSYSILN